MTCKHGSTSVVCSYCDAETVAQYTDKKERLSDAACLHIIAASVADVGMPDTADQLRAIAERMEVRPYTGAPDAASLLAALRPAVQEVIRKQMVDFGEIPDRTSPEDFPDGYVLTREEIVGAFLRVIAADRAEVSAKPERRCTCYVLPHADDCGMLMGITKSGAMVFASETPRTDAFESRVVNGDEDRAPLVNPLTNAIDYCAAYGEAIEEMERLERELADANRYRMIAEEAAPKAFKEGQAYAAAVSSSYPVGNLTIDSAMVVRALAAAGAVTINFRPPWHADEQAIVRLMLKAALATVSSSTVAPADLWKDLQEALRIMGRLASIISSTPREAYKDWAIGPEIPYDMVRVAEAFAAKPRALPSASSLTLTTHEADFLRIILRNLEHVTDDETVRRDAKRIREKMPRSSYVKCQNP